MPPEFGLFHFKEDCSRASLQYVLQCATDFHGDITLEILSYTYGSTEEKIWIEILIPILLSILIHRCPNITTE